jgi:osmotically inducible lipoprotein OsmB
MRLFGRRARRSALGARLGALSSNATRPKEISMKPIKQSIAGVVVATALVGLSGCSGMSPQTRNTAIGAGVGGVAGHVLTNGSTLGTVGGAAAGGLIGHEVK